MQPKILTENDYRRVLEVVDAGLTDGMGVPVPGEMCVEAATCYALGEPHGAAPSCVYETVRDFRIRLNDAAWPNEHARAQGLRRVAIAALGSLEIDCVSWSVEVSRETIGGVLPLLAEHLGGKLRLTPATRARLLAAAELCRREKSASAARALSRVFKAVYAACAEAAVYAAAAEAAADAAAAAGGNRLLCRQSGDGLAVGDVEREVSGD